MSHNTRISTTFWRGGRVSFVVSPLLPILDRGEDTVSNSWMEGEGKRERWRIPFRSQKQDARSVLGRNFLNYLAVRGIIRRGRFTNPVAIKQVGNEEVGGFFGTDCWRLFPCFYRYFNKFFSQWKTKAFPTNVRRRNVYTFLREEKLVIWKLLDWKSGKETTIDDCFCVCIDISMNFFHNEKWKLFQQTFEVSRNVYSFRKVERELYSLFD